jgi:hypothetical protein
VRRALVALGLCALGCGQGKTLEIRLAPACDLSSAESVRIDVSGGGLATHSETRGAAEVFGPSGPARLLFLFPDSVTSVEVVVRVLAAGGTERASGSVQVSFDGPGNREEQLPLTGNGCLAPPDLGGDLGFDLTAPHDLADPCGVLRLSGGSANAPARDAVYNPAGAFSVEAWVYPDATGTPPTSQNLVGHWGLGSASTGSWALYLAGMKPSLGITCDGTLTGNFQSVTAANALPQRQWHHVAGTFNPASQLGRVWVDGVIAGSGPITCSAAHATTGIPLQLAYNDPEGGGSFLGELDEVRLSSGLRYSAPFTPAARVASDATTLALYHFDAPESVGTSCADSSSQMNASALSGSAALSVRCR